MTQAGSKVNLKTVAVKTSRAKKLSTCNTKLLYRKNPRIVICNNLAVDYFDHLQELRRT